MLLLLLMHIIMGDMNHKQINKVKQMSNYGYFIKCTF